MKRGHILVPMGDRPRYHAFEASLARLLHQGDMPDRVGLMKHQGVSIPASLNHGIRRMLADSESAWLWIIGDDHTFAPDILARLMTHDLPAVVPLTLRRAMPYTGVCFDANDSPIIWQPHHRGVQRVHAAGSAGLLVRRWVLELVGDPWFTHRAGEFAAEDLSFCDRLREHDVPLYVDLDTWMGHITPMEVWPIRNERGAWGAASRNSLTMEVL